ncbi:MATH and LRR domain-containing protein PFE0570w-like [Bolinopsis microptera]|uniref:MATH and LRR domain-containing protein PFE0570w-like n=1 Tax=Bolinopsis microptera TaxID=2820187 RepID=UPI0030796711
MVVAEQQEAQTEKYTNVLETSRLRPDVEPFVPKSQNGQPYYVMGNGGFSLDAPEFIPNVYASNGEMYTWVPNQFIVAPATNHPRFSIPRFRDKFMRQHRNRNNNNNNNNNNSSNNNGNNGRQNYNNSHNGRYENSDQRDNNYHQQHRTYNKIEQRNNKSRESNGGPPLTPAAPQKPIKIEKKKDNKDKTSNQNSNNYKGNTEVIDDLITPVVVPDIDEGVMSYRAALIGNEPPKLENSNKPVAEPLPTKVESNKAEPEQPQLMADRERPSRERSDRRSEKFVPAESEREGFNKPHYNGRGGGRPKPTKGSEIQLNIFSLVQDKKVKKKKLPRAKEDDKEAKDKAANQLDSSAPAVKRGKEREEGKPKKLSKMKKIITKEKSEISENGDDTKTPISLPEFCCQTVTTELNSSLSAFLSQLREYNDKAYRTGSSHKRRYCCGLREARKYLKLNKVKCIIIPPNIDKIVSKGGLYDCVHDIVHLSSEQNVPIFYGLNKTKISKILARPKSTITSAVSVFSYHGAEVLWQDVLHNVAIARERYQNESADQETVKAESDEGSSDEGEEFEDDNNDEDDLMVDLVNESADNDSVSSSFVDSGIENNEISSLSIENGHTSGEG